MDGYIQGRSESVGTGVSSEVGLPPWIDENLIQKTQKVWGPYYRKGLTTEEAIEVIINVGQLFEAVSTEDHR